MRATAFFGTIPFLLAACGDDGAPTTHDASPPPVDVDAATPPPPDPATAAALRMIEEGRQTFRYETFGDEAFWGGTLRLHEAVATIAPVDALGLGLKVDVDALPQEIIDALAAGDVDLTDPATTLALLRLDAVVGVKGIFEGDTMTSIGIECALCHSTVDDSFTAGVGHRLDGWPNRDLNVGAIISAAPDLSAVTTLLGVDEPTLRTVLASWGPGKFDAAVFLDGKAFRDDGGSGATLLPPAYGLAGVDGHTYTGWGSVTYWNAFVANLEMQGQGTFWDPRLEDEARFPIAAANDFGNRRPEVDRVTAKLPALQFYQLALEAPEPPAGSFDAAAAARGEALFLGDAQCSRCHVPPIYTEPGWNRHTAAEIGIDDFQAQRSPDVHYRTTPLRGAWSRAKGGYYHDGRFATLADVVDHYDAHLSLGLTDGEKADLVEYVKSL
jgi:cytochrome c peroxidase